MGASEGPLTPMWSRQGLSRLVLAAEDSAMEQTLAQHSQTLDHPVEVSDHPVEVLDHPVEVLEAPAEEEEVVDAQLPMNSNAPLLTSSSAQL